MTVVGLDVGGAHLKLADTAGRSRHCPYPLWKRPDALSDALQGRLAEFPDCAHVAVTMTGELADCFATKEEGVRCIVEATERAAGSRRVQYYQTHGALVDAGQAVKDYRLTAAANWHALATFVAKEFHVTAGLLIDIGSTTCDLIPLQNGQPATDSTSDLHRILRGELLYTGIDRSPVCAVTQQVTLRGQVCWLAQELFATMADVYLLLGHLPEEEGFTDTADGRPRTREHAQARLARMLCADARDLTHTELIDVATQVASHQAMRLAEGIRRIADRIHAPRSQVIMAGHGDFLVHRVLDQLEASWPTRSLAEHLGADLSRAATAYAVAQLARGKDQKSGLTTK